MAPECRIWYHYLKLKKMRKGLFWTLKRKNETTKRSREHVTPQWTARSTFACWFYFCLLYKWSANYLSKLKFTYNNKRNLPLFWFVCKWISEAHLCTIIHQPVNKKYHENSFSYIARFRCFLWGHLCQIDRIMISEIISTK